MGAQVKEHGSSVKEFVSFIDNGEDEAALAAVRKAIEYNPLVFPFLCMMKKVQFAALFCFGYCGCCNRICYPCKKVCGCCCYPCKMLCCLFRCVKYLLFMRMCYIERTVN